MPTTSMGMVHLLISLSKTYIQIWTMTSFVFSCQAHGLISTDQLISDAKTCFRVNKCNYLILVITCKDTIASTWHLTAISIFSFQSFISNQEKTICMLFAVVYSFVYVCLAFRLTSFFLDAYCLSTSGADGLLSEAKWLLDLGLLPNTNSATRAIGYKQVNSLFAILGCA